VSIASKFSLWVFALLVLNGCLNNAKFSSLEPQFTDSNTETNIAKPIELRAAENPEFYLVKTGDTLYSIAFRFGLEYKKLAAANRIGQGYRIYEGQSLVLKEVEEAPRIVQKTTVKPINQPASNVSKMVTKLNSQENDAPIADNSVAVSRNSPWIWPHNGKIVRAFSGEKSNQKGIDLNGRIGDSVLAATNGVVVYAGNGLPGYGNLIILEHANSLLSAYAFTEKILVKEKDQVAVGQKIATMGKQGDQPGLHFEIRQNGKPVDPLGFLPKR